MRLSCLCTGMHKKCLFQIRAIIKPVTFFNMVVKVVFVTKCNETHYSLEKKCLQVQIMVTPR